MPADSDPTEAEIRRVFGWIVRQSAEQGVLCASFRPPLGRVTSRTSENQLHWDESEGPTVADAIIDRFGPLKAKPVIGDDLI